LPRNPHLGLACPCWWRCGCRDAFHLICRAHRPDGNPCLESALDRGFLFPLRFTWQCQQPSFLLKHLIPSRWFLASLVISVVVVGFKQTVIKV
jgi:hypothetical protein